MHMNGKASHDSVLTSLVSRASASDPPEVAPAKHQRYSVKYRHFYISPNIYDNDHMCTRFPARHDILMMCRLHAEK